jgi:hypothetical protein
MVGRYHIYVLFVITHVVSAGYTTLPWSAGTIFTSYFYPHMWYRPIITLCHGRPVPYLRTICDHTCGIGRPHNLNLVGRYHIYVLFVTAHVVSADFPISLWFGQYHIHVLFLITHVVSAGYTTLPWSAGTIFYIYFYPHMWYRPIITLYRGRPVP